MAKKGGGKQQASRPIMSDEAFLSRYLELGENASALARELKVTQPAVGKRLRKLGAERMDKARAAGSSAALLRKGEVGKAVADAASKAGFQVGVNAAVGSFNVFARLTNYCSIADTMIGHLQSEINEHMAKPNAKLKGYHIDNLSKLLNLASKISVDFHKARKDVMEVEALANFFEAVANVMEGFDPDSRERIYAELLKIGAYDQAEFLSVSEVS